MLPKALTEQAVFPKAWGAVVGALQVLAKKDNGMDLLADQLDLIGMAVGENMTLYTSVLRRNRTTKKKI